MHAIEIAAYQVEPHRPRALDLREAQVLASRNGPGNIDDLAHARIESLGQTVETDREAVVNALASIAATDIP